MWFVVVFGWALSSVLWKFRLRFFVTVRVVSWLVGTVLGCCVSDVV